MKKYTVIGLVSSSVVLGEYEAESKEAAEKMAEEDENADWNPAICHHCSDIVEVGDVYQVDVYEDT